MLATRKLFREQWRAWLAASLQMFGNLLNTDRFRWIMMIASRWARAIANRYLERTAPKK